MACRQNVRSIKRRHRQCSVAPPLLVDVMLQSFALVYQRYFVVYGVVVLMMFVIMFIHRKKACPANTFLGSESVCRQATDLCDNEVSSTIIVNENRLLSSMCVFE
jgi:hypothetical protein